MDKSRAIYEKMMQTDYFSQWMGVELLEISEGYCKLQMRVRKEMLNGFGIIHGGVTLPLPIVLLHLLLTRMGV